MRIVAISDTHGLHNQMLFPIPEGDVLIHAGDTSGHGTIEELKDFNSWLGLLPHKHKLMIAGNHNKEWYNDYTKDACIRTLTNAIYLEDTEIVIGGIKFYGSPWTPEYYNWAFMLPRKSQQLSDKWAEIPDDTNVLITHGPPYGILDTANDKEKIGDETLLRRIQELPVLKAHIFGHVHEGHGEQGIFHNVAICDIQYRPVNPPTVLEANWKLE